MNRTIIGFHRDDEGDWVAELSCSHGQHVRHRPPFQVRPWALLEDERNARLGTALDCPLCDRAELPAGVQLIGSTPQWDEHSIPKGLRRTHRLSSGRWGQLVVLEGQLQFTAHTDPVIDVIVGAGSVQAIPPDVEHEVQPLGSVRFLINFFVDQDNTANSKSAVGKEEVSTDDVAIARVADQGGEAACWAHLLCPECGAVLDGGSHRQGCRFDVVP